MPAFLISCSNNLESNQINSVTSDEINEQYNIFSNALVKENINNNLYFENFIFDENNQSILNIEEMCNILSLPNLSNSYEYNFLVIKDQENNLIRIRMKMKLKNSNANFVEYNNIEKIIYSVKTLTEQEKISLNSIYTD